MRLLRMNNRGTALVEFVVIALLLIILVMGIIDFAMLSKDHTMLSNAVQMGARQAQLSYPASEVTEAVLSSASTLDTSKIAVHSYYRVASAAGLYPSDWTEGTPDAVAATSSVQVRVRAEYQCNRVSGTLFGTNPVTISTESVQLRE